MTTRIFNALIGIWLVVSAFMWPHTTIEFTITVAAAALTFVLSILEMYTRNARYVNAGVAVALFLSAIALPVLNRSTTWNNAIVAIAILVVALIDRGPGSVRQERELYGRV